MAGAVARCASGKRCVSRTSDGPALTALPLCGGCVKDIQKCYDELPNYALALGDFKGYKPQSVGQSRVSGGGSEGSTPLNVTVLDLLDEIRAVEVAVNAHRIRDLMMLPDGVEVALTVRKVHSKADAVVGLGRVWQRRRVECPECELPTLGGWLGEDAIYCTNSECGTSLTKSEYEDHCVAKAKR